MNSNGNEELSNSEQVSPDLSSKEFNYIRSLLEKDAEEIALDTSFFSQLEISPKDFIDERISLCEKFELDFWLSVKDNCNDYNTKRLQVLYNGGDLRRFIESYESPSEDELAKNFLQMIMRKRNSGNGKL